MDNFIHEKLHELANEDRDYEDIRNKLHNTITDITMYLDDKVIIPRNEYERLKKLVNKKEDV